MALQSVFTQWGWKIMGEPDAPLAPNIQISAREEGIIERANIPSEATIAAAAAMPTVSMEQWNTGALTQAQAETLQAEMGQEQIVGPAQAGLAPAPIGALVLSPSWGLGGGTVGTSELTKFVVPGVGLPVGALPGWIAAAAGAIGATGLVTGTAAAILSLLSKGGSATQLISQAAGLLKGGNGISGNGGTTMAEQTTGQSVDGATSVNGVSFGGPGVPEPPAGMVARAWKTKAFSYTKGEYWVYFWRLLDGRVMCWNEAKREAKIWKPKKNMVLSQNPRLPALLKFVRKANAMLFRLDKQADKARRQFGVVRVVHESGKKR